VEGDTIFISVQPEDLHVLLRMDGFTWSAVTINIKRSDGIVDTAQPSSEAEKTKAMLRSVLERRYDMDAKFLDLSALGQDEELKASAIFDSKSTTSKFFPALMRVLELAFDQKAERDAAIQSVSLAHNDLENLTVVSTLSETLPNLHNLDLSNNKLATLDSISLFRRRFHHLKHLIVSGNPLEQNEPNYATEILKWYSSLTQLNNIQVRTEEEAAARSNVSHMPFPIRTPLFQDEGGIAENFIRNFFVGIDTDRTALANVFYDDNSEFSFAVNTSAPRDPANRPAPQEWEQYINNSRNLKRLTQLPARKKRQFSGAKAIADVLTSIPATKHPDLATQATKWLIESHIQPNVPDPTGQSRTGVDGFQISVHGEFQELQSTADQPGKQRSVDHLFIVGPGGSTGVRIHSHQFTIRAYGGSQAYQPEDLAAYAAIVGTSNLPSSQPVSSSMPAPTNAAATAAAATIPQPSQPPAGLTVELAEQMVLELQKQTRMTLQYAKDCLEQVSWDFNKALEVFGNVRASLPAEAFVAVA
jgi:nuclear RNA export factor